MEVIRDNLPQISTNFLGNNITISTEVIITHLQKQNPLNQYLKYPIIRIEVIATYKVG